MRNVQILEVEEYRISPETRLLIAGLLGRTFPGYPNGQTYYMQLPAFRILAMQENKLIGQMAVEHRMINVGGTLFRIFGVADFCVDPAFRRQKTGTHLLEHLERLGAMASVDFVVLVAINHVFYELNGFFPVDNPCRWVAIRNHQTSGLVQDHLSGDLLVKPISGKKWEEGLVDFLGTIF